MWIFLLVVLTYCFTVGLTAKYREESVKMRELRVKDKEEYEAELGKVLLELSDIREENELLKQRFY